MMRIKERATDSIQPYEKNPRQNRQAVEAVAQSIDEFGFRQPIVIDPAGTIIIGHVRWMAAQQLELKTVPVHIAEGLTPEQARALRIADNKLHELSAWDQDLLTAELEELTQLGIDLQLLGFNAEELNDLFSETTTDGLEDPDFIPDPPETPKTEEQDLWILGEHRLLCGDAGNPEHVDRLLEGADVHLVNTDPPYNVGVEPRSNNARAAQGKKSQRKQATHRQLRPKDQPLKNDFVSDETFRRLLNAWFGSISRVLLPGRGFYIWGGYANCANYPAALQKNGLYFSQALIWVKEHPVMTRKDFMGNHEWCFYGWREGARHRFWGPANATDVWSVKKVNPQSMVHLTEKPVELASRALQYSSRRGEHVLDLFGGSGSTLIAAEQTRRRAFLMELDRSYCDVIVERWERYTGRQAERISAAQVQSRQAS